MPRHFVNARNIPLNSGYVPSLKFELFGDWEKTIKLLQKMGPEVKEASLKAQLKVGKQICKIVKGHLRNQDLGWVALNEKYAEKKSDSGLDGRTLIAYGAYYNAIQVWQSGNRHLVNIGVRNGIYTHDLRGKRSKLEVAKIAVIHEFASGKRIKKRPLWNPSIVEIGGAKGIKKMYINALVYHLSRAGIPVKNFRKIF